MRAQSLAYGLLAISILLGGCQQSETVTPDSEDGGIQINTADPAVAQTLQAEVAATAAYIATLFPVATATTMPLPTFDISQAEGTPVSQLTGVCPVPDGYVQHSRDGFCISTPAEWLPLNVDGGLAASLNTTPGKTIFLQPDWAASSDVCYLFIYIGAETSAELHLQTRHVEISASNELSQLTDVAMRSLGDLAIPGFYWTLPNGSSGAAFADIVAPNQLLHISFGGTQCSSSDVSSVISTLRIQLIPR